MDKVDFTGASLLGPSLRPGLKPEPRKARPKGESSGAARARKTLFSDMLEKTAKAELGPLRELEPSEEALTELMDAVHSAGSDLIDRPFHNEILKYKQAVRNFMHYVVENGYKLQMIPGLKKKTVVRGESRWKDVVYHQVQVIDKKLEELAAAILSGQSTQLARVSKLDEITGLLVDLTISGAIRKNDG